MNFRDLLRVVWSNLNRMRGRAIMTALGVVIGTAAIVVLIALASGLQESATGDATAFGPVNQITLLPGAFFRAFGSTTGSDESVLTPDAIKEIARREGVTAITPKEQVAAPTTIKLNRLVGSGSLTGIDPLVVRDMGLEVERGTDILGNWTVIVGAKVGESFVDPRERSGTQVQRSGDEEPLDLLGQTLIVSITKTGDDGKPVTRTVRLRVGGVLEENGSDDYAIYMALADVEDLSGWYAGKRPDRRNDGYSQAIVVVDDTQQLLPIQRELEADGFFAFSAQSTLQQINVLFAVIQAVFGGIGAIALLVAAIGIANTMIMSILERTREIGLMKAVGATNRDVMSIFIAEAGAIGFFGGIAGVLFGIGAAKVIDVIAQAYINAQLASSGSTSSDPISIAIIPIWLPIFAIVFSLIIGLVSGIYPALRAVQLDPVNALKYE
jgi:putative ABC transport system permease protein